MYVILSAVGLEPTRLPIMTVSALSKGAGPRINTTQQQCNAVALLLQSAESSAGGAAGGIRISSQGLWRPQHLSGNSQQCPTSTPLPSGRWVAETVVKLQHGINLEAAAACGDCGTLPRRAPVSSPCLLLQRPLLGYDCCRIQYQVL